ncbi:MAG: DUF2142 domain-containing protein [Micromonosporaceae bacterium]
MGYLLLSAGWALALPSNATYDEEDHAIRAYAVASGQVYADGDTVVAPRSLLPDNVDCTWERGDPKSATCQRPVDDRSLARTPSTAARYSPVYYLPVGLPLLVSPDHTGIVAARLVSALLSALLLASAYATAVRIGSRLLLAGLVLASTPMLFNLAASINPNGLEIAAGISLWVALLGLLLTPTRSAQPAAAPLPPGAAADPPGATNPPGEGSPPSDADPAGEGSPLGDDGATRRLVWLAAISAALLITVRQLGPLLLVLAATGCVLLARRARVPELVRRRDVRRIGGGLVAAASLGFLVWTATSRIADPAPAPKVANPMRLTLPEALDGIVDIRLPFYAKQLIGQFSYGETPLPTGAAAVWYALILLLVVPAAMFAGWRYRLVYLGLFAVLTGLLVAMELRFLPHSGWFSHSRYVMPAGVGLLLLPAFVPRFTRWLGPVPAAWFTRLAVLVTGAIHLAALAKVASRFQNDPAEAVNPFTGEWLPLAGPVVPLLSVLLGVTVLAALTWRYVTPVSRLETEPVPTGRPGRSLHAANH